MPMYIYLYQRHLPKARFPFPHGEKFLLPRDSGFQQRNEQTGKGTTTTVTVYDYFLKTYNVRIQCRPSPLLIFGLPHS
jgi:hypothetical protein